MQRDTFAFIRLPYLLMSHISVFLRLAGMALPDFCRFFFSEAIKRMEGFHIHSLQVRPLKSHIEVFII